MLFRKKIEPACAYCKFASPGEEDTVICPKKGVMEPWKSCRSFDYDPLKRVPEVAQPPVTDVDPSAFQL